MGCVCSLMASVYPEIILNDTKSKVSETSKFYFCSKLGAVTEIETTSKESAVEIYLNTLMPSKLVGCMCFSETCCSYATCENV